MSAARRTADDDPRVAVVNRRQLRRPAAARATRNRLLLHRLRHCSRLPARTAHPTQARLLLSTAAAARARRCFRAQSITQFKFTIIIRRIIINVRFYKSSKEKKLEDKSRQIPKSSTRQFCNPEKERNAVR